jgi:hypothetical protein
VSIVSPYWVQLKLNPLVLHSLRMCHILVCGAFIRWRDLITKQNLIGFPCYVTLTATQGSFASIRTGRSDTGNIVRIGWCISIWGHSIGLIINPEYMEIQFSFNSIRIKSNSLNSAQNVWSRGKKSNPNLLPSHYSCFLQQWPLNNALTLVI